MADSSWRKVGRKPCLPLFLALKNIWVPVLSLIHISFGRKISEKETGYVCRTGTGVLMAGLAFITVYAQVFSLFSGVGLWANVLLLLACAVCAVLLRRQLAAFILGKWRESSPGGRLFLAVFVLLMAYGTSRGYMHVDTGLYHAQARCV